MDQMEWKSTSPLPAPLTRSEISMEDWTDFRKKFENYIKGVTISSQKDRNNYIYNNSSGYYTPSEERKVAKLLKVIGAGWEEVYNKFPIDRSSGQTLQEVLNLFEDYCKINDINSLPASFKFHTRRQQPGEKFDDFLADICNKAEVCRFGYLKDRMILDRIVVGVSDRILQKQLLSSNKGLPLDTVIMLCRFAEIYRSQCVKEIEKTSAPPVA